MNEPKTNKKIGSLLMDAGKLKLSDIELVLHSQNELGLKFGEAAVKLGMVAEADILAIIAQQFDYPLLKRGEGGFSDGLVAAYQPFTPQVEAIRSLRSQLLLRWFNKGQHKQLAVVGVASGEACSLLTANLAIVFSQLGQSTVVVDSNLRNPRQHLMFGLGKRKGLSDCLIGSTGIMDAICKFPEFVDLSVLPAGTLPPNPQELLGRTAFRTLMDNLTNSYDITLWDTPDGLLYADTLNIVAEIGAALLVIHKHHTRMSEARALQNQIASAKAQIVGVVLHEF